MTSGSYSGASRKKQKRGKRGGRKHKKAISPSSRMRTQSSPAGIGSVPGHLQRARCQRRVPSGPLLNKVGMGNGRLCKLRAGSSGQ